MKKLLTLALLTMAAGAFGSVEEKYNRYCIACHASGAAGAPIAGEVEAWKPRLEKGMDALLVSTNNGIGGMPAKGLCSDCTDDDFKALIEYMSKPAQ